MGDFLPLAWILIAIGLVFMAAELLLPTHGILFGLGVGAAIIGVALTFRYGLSTGVITLMVVIVVVPLLGGVLLRIWPKTPLGKHLFLPGPEDDQTVANMPVNLELERLRGRYGKTLSALRPCGVVNFDGRRVDTMTRGEMIEQDRWVLCVDVKDGRVIVREAQQPPDLDMADTALFT
jgi:membrane-bound serine protease (ClpP class)